MRGGWVKLLKVTSSKEDSWEKLPSESEAYQSKKRKTQDIFGYLCSQYPKWSGVGCPKIED